MNMNTNTLAAGVIGFLLGGLVVSIAAELENSAEPAPRHSGSSVHPSIDPWWSPGAGLLFPRPPAKHPGAHQASLLGN